MDNPDTPNKPLTPGEAFALKRRNFIEKVRQYFHFLISEFGYAGPSHECWRQENGSITRDQFDYENLLADRGISIINAYHPDDYGFEIRFYKPGDPASPEEMVYYFLKEDQDIEQSYLEQAARKLRDDFTSVITGQKWV